MYKLFYFSYNEREAKYRSIVGVWPSINSFLNLMEDVFGFKATRFLREANFIKIPFSGYHSSAHTGFSLSDLRVPRSEARRPEK